MFAPSNGACRLAMESHDTDRLWTQAESVYANWIMNEDESQIVPFDRLCAQHPRVARQLRKIRAQDGALREFAERSGMAGGGYSDSIGAPIESDDAAPGEFSPSAAGARDLINAVRNREMSVGKYFVSREIGSGSMGRVLKAWDKDLRRFVALKIMRTNELPDSSDQPQSVPSRALVKFVEEAQVTAQLDHPNIVPVHEFGVTRAGQSYFTMKLVKGREFGKIIESVHGGGSNWSITRALGILLKACEALSYAHDKGVVHRDLKPANIMVGRFGAVYVMDWGLSTIDRTGGAQRLNSGEMTERVRTSSRARPVEPSADPMRTQEGATVGTPLYMSPEQAFGRLDEIGPASDVYGVGAILYDLLAGIPPYKRPGIGALEVLEKIREGPPRPLSVVAPNVPRELQAIVAKAMQRSPTERYSSIADLSQDLIAFIEGRVVGAWHPGPVRGLGKWVRRNRGLAAVGGACVLLLASSFFGKPSTLVRAAAAPPALVAARADAIAALQRALTGELSDERRVQAFGLVELLMRSDAPVEALEAATRQLVPALEPEPGR